MIRYVIDTHKRCLNSLGEPQMPEVIDPNESESRQSLYRDLLSHLNTTLWGSPSILPYSESGKHTLDFNPVEAFDKSKNPEGAIFAEPEINWIESQIRGYPKAIAKAIRKVMQNEIKVRGQNPYKPLLPSEASPQATTDAGRYKYDVQEMLKKKPLEEVKELYKDYYNQGYINEEEFKGFQAEITRQASYNPRSEDAIASRLLRGTWYRGQESYPKILGKEKVIDPVAGKEVEELVTHQFGKEYAGEAPTYMGMRASSSNVGEPHGISLSYDPKVSARFNAPETISSGDKFNEVRNKLMDLPVSEDSYHELLNRTRQLTSTTKVGRAMPLYGGPPEDKILMAWKPEHGAEFRSAYVEAAQEMANKYPGFKKSIEALDPGESGEAIKYAIDKAKNVWTPKWGESGAVELTEAAYTPKRYKSSRDEFNSIMSRILRERGWKGMLHSPHRYQEYELRMFDPYDVMHIDKRAVAQSSVDNPMQSQAVQRLREMKSPLMREHEAVTEGRPRSLGEFYRDITREELLGQPKVKGIPSKPKEYDFELDLNDINLDFNDTTTKLLQSTEYAHELTKAKLKSVTDKAKGYIEKAQAKKDFEKALGHNAEINDFEEVWESYKELGKTKTSFKDFISDW